MLPAPPESALPSPLPESDVFFHQAPVGYLLVDEAGTVVDANLTSTVMLGAERGVIVGQPLCRFIEPEHHMALYRHLRRAMDGDGTAGAGGLRQVAEFLMRRPVGTRFHAHVESRVLGRSPARGRTLLLAMLDISSRKEVECALRQSERRYRTLFESSRDAIFIFDGTGHLMEANQAGLLLLGAESMEALRGRLRKTLYPAPQREASEAALLRHLYAEDAVPFEVNVQRADGELVPVEVSASLVHSELQVLTLAHFRDVRERHRTAQERAHLEERLRQAHKLEAIGRLAGGVAHDMNNVLGVIMSLASLLLEDLPEDDARHKSVLDILAASRRGRDLTQNLLGFARKEPARRELLSAAGVARQVAEMLWRTIPKNIAIHLDLPEGLEAIEGDSSQLYQAFMNLCLNAVDAMPAGGVLTLAARRCPPPPREDGEDGEAESGIELTVTDTGMGMDPHTLACSFEPFFTTKPMGKGTGLGLAMVYGTVRSHGGTVTIESEPGSGTTVRVVLPAVAGMREARVPAVPEPAPPPPPEPAPRAGPRTVLLVDDEPMVRSAARRLLSRLGYTVLQAESGPEGLALFAERRAEVAAVILDLSMPVMDGAEVLGRLRALDPQVPVLLCSGYSKEGVPEELMRGGGVGYLRKPFEMQELAHTLEQVCGG